MTHAELWSRHEATIRRFWAGQLRGIASLTPSIFRAPQDADDATRLALIREALANMVPDPHNVTMPSVYPDYGTISMPVYWGGRCRVSRETGCPFIEPAAQTLSEALALRPKPVDDPAMDAARAVRLWRDCLPGPHRDYLWARSPDFQSVLNTAGLIMNQEEMLLAMYEQPEDLQVWLGRVCDFLIELHAWLRRETKGRICGSIWPHTVLPADLGVSLTEDLMPLLSADLWKTFGLPHLRRIERAFGPLQIHCCGDWGRHAPTLLESGLRIRAVEFHYPFTTIEELAPLARATGMAIVPYFIADKQTRFSCMWEYYLWLWKEWPDLRFWFTLGGEPDDENQAFLRLING